MVLLLKTRKPAIAGGLFSLCFYFSNSGGNSTPILGRFLGFEMCGLGDFFLRRGLTRFRVALTLPALPHRNAQNRAPGTPNGLRSEVAAFGGILFRGLKSPASTWRRFAPLSVLSLLLLRNVLSHPLLRKGGAPGGFQ